MWTTVLFLKVVERGYFIILGLKCWNSNGIIFYWCGISFTMHELSPLYCFCDFIISASFAFYLVQQKYTTAPQQNNPVSHFLFLKKKVTITGSEAVAATQPSWQYASLLVELCVCNLHASCSTAQLMDR